METATTILVVAVPVYAIALGVSLAANDKGDPATGIVITVAGLIKGLTIMYLAWIDAA